MDGILTDVPRFLHLAIFKKMSPKAFVRTYRSCKQVKNTLELNAHNINVQLLFSLQIIFTNLTRARLEIYFSTTYYLIRSKLREDFQEKSDRFGLYFFKFHDFIIRHETRKLHRRIRTAEVADVISILKRVQFSNKFRTDTRYQLARFIPVLENKKTVLDLWHANSPNVEMPDKALQFLTEITCYKPQVQVATYLLDHIADHTSILNFDACETASFPSIMTSFGNLAKRSLHSQRKTLSVRVEGNSRASVEDLANGFPTPAQRHVSEDGAHILLVYPTKPSNRSHFVLHIISHIFNTVVVKFDLRQAEFCDGSVADLIRREEATEMSRMLPLD